MIVIDPAAIVTVQLSNDEMRQLHAHCNQWLAMWRNYPVLIERYAERGGIPLNAPDLSERAYRTLVMGRMGEMAVAQYLDAPYALNVQPGDINPTDVDGVEVRAVDNYLKRLITHEYDKPAPYVLAVCDDGTASVVLRGWLHLRHCNVPAHWWADAPKPAYFTPATELHPMAMLRHYYEQRKRR